jgi:hypothetical protein
MRQRLATLLYTDFGATSQLNPEIRLRHSSIVNHQQHILRLQFFYFV